MIVDSHVHLWSLSRPECSWPTPAEGVLHRDFLLDDLKSEVAGTGVDSVVLVQSQESDSDTDWLLDIASDEPLILAVVGWVDLHRGDSCERIDLLHSRRKFAGVRPMVQHRAADWYDDPALDRALAMMADRGVGLDALVRVPHLPSIDRLAARHPSLRIVIDHAAKPTIDTVDGFTQWRRLITPLANRPNLSCKLSGLLTERGERPPESVTPCIDELLAMFGPDRLMWGSDWPVLNASGGYGEWLALARSAIPEALHERVFGRTAQQFYDLQLERAA